MSSEPLWATLRYVQREDMISFHVGLFRCFLFGFLDAHSDLAILSQGSRWILAVLDWRPMGVDLPGSRSRGAPLGRHSDHDNSTTIQCPPKRRYGAALPSFTHNPSTAPTSPVPPFIRTRPINHTHVLHADPVSNVAFDPPGPPLITSALRPLTRDCIRLGATSRGVPGGDAFDGRPTGMVALLLLGLLTLVMVTPHRARRRRRSGSARTVCPPDVAVKLTSSDNRVIRPVPLDHVHNVHDVLTGEATRDERAGMPGDVGQHASMPGAWHHSRLKHNVVDTCEESSFDFHMILWTLWYSCPRMGMKIWDHLPGLSWICVIGIWHPWNRGSNDVTVIQRGSGDGSSSVRQAFYSGGSTPAVPNGSEQQVAVQGHVSFDSSFSIRHLRSSIMVLLGRCCKVFATRVVTSEDTEFAQNTTLDVVCQDTTGFALMALDQEAMSCDADESASEGGSDGTEGLFGVDAQYRRFKWKDGVRVHGRRQDGPGALSLKRAHSSGDLCKERDLSDDDDEGDGGSFWTGQVNARLSGERYVPRTPCRYRWSDVSSWAWRAERREDQSDNWRMRSSQVDHLPGFETMNDGVRQTDRWCSSPLLGGDISHSEDTCTPTAQDGPRGIYVVPQKRTGARCWSPVSSPPLDGRRPGLGFFPFRRTSALLTSEAWRPGCLYIPDPPEDEGRQADAWWDGLSLHSGLGADQGLCFGRDGSDEFVSWRDRYENDPASRRFISGHRRAMTGG